MIVIRHKETAEPLLEFAGDSLAGAVLDHAVLLAGDLKERDLRGARMRGVDLCQADLRGAVLDGADLREADITLATLGEASFRNANLTDARLQAVNLELTGPARTDFSGAELTRVNLKNSNLSGCRFLDGEMRRIDLTHCNLTSAQLSGANLTEANFSYSNLHGADFSYAMVLSSLFNEVDLRGANLRHSELTAAVFNGVRFGDADLTRAHLSKTVFARCRELHQARGLDLLDYLNPSSIDIETLRHSLHGLTGDFLSGCGTGSQRDRDAARKAADREPPMTYDSGCCGGWRLETTLPRRSGGACKCRSFRFTPLRTLASKANSWVQAAQICRCSCTSLVSSGLNL